MPRKTPMHQANHNERASVHRSDAESETQGLPKKFRAAGKPTVELRNLNVFVSNPEEPS
jgi:hypothetical protein